MKWLRAVIANRQLKTRVGHLEDQVRQLQSALDSVDLDMCDLSDRFKTLSGRKAKRKERSEAEIVLADNGELDLNEKIKRGIAVA